MVQEQVPVKSPLSLAMSLPAPKSRLESSQPETIAEKTDTSGIAESRLARSQPETITEKKGTSGIADIGQSQVPALLLQVLSEDDSAVLCTSLQPVP